MGMDIGLRDRLDMMEQKASMLKWWDAVKDLDVPQPKTTVIRLSDGERGQMESLAQGGKMSDQMLDKFKAEARKMGYPLFMRTDQTSCKHNWENTCFVEDEESLEANIVGLLTHNSMLGMFGLPVWGLVFREYIEMDSVFKAFRGRMPINPERRYFAEGGKINCVHAYWVEDAILFRKDEEPDDWKDKLGVVNGAICEFGADGEEDEMMCHALKVSQALTAHLGGEWSIDFCRGKDGVWYFIDCAPAELSWHPDHDGVSEAESDEISSCENILRGLGS